MSNAPESPGESLRLKRALVALQTLQSRLEALESARTEPIAIVGVGCRFPGAHGPEEFWTLLHDGVDAIREIPGDRWDSTRYYDPDPGAAGKIATRYGGFLDGVDLFDPQFFGIAPREAVSLDPQHRLLLEVSWEALEHGGISPDGLIGSLTGVFVGISSNDFAQLVMTRDAAEIDHYMGSGNARSVAAGRLSYLLGFKGPSLAVDTACSSSLVATHLACESLRRRECHLALAAGVNLLFAPEVSISHSRAHMLAQDGRCKTFDRSADGFGRSEGCGVVVLKRLENALADRDNVLALILGSALNHDGRTSGLTVPSGPSQEAVIRAALANAGIGPLTVSFVEAHGTGTRLGDPIEVGALAAVLCEGRSMEDPLLLGSVKTNIGHLEAGAGIAGLLKAVLSLQHEEIPRHLHVREPNPLIPWDHLPIRLATASTPWHSGGRRRIAGVSSFGFSGTNAHIVIAEAPAQPAPEATPRSTTGSLLVLSAKTESALRTLADRYVEHFTASPSIDLDTVAYSAATGRSHFPHRLSVIADSTAACREQLRAFLAGESSPRMTHGHVLIGERPRIAFLFSGQGSQYPGMAHGLYREQPAFREAIDRCENILRAWMDRPLTEVLFDVGPDVLSRTLYTQPALFALEYALAELWMSWGIQPDILIGHSVGEYVAACVAGVFSLDDGLMLIAERARLMDAIRAPGEMVAVLADEALVTRAVAPHAREVNIAAINGPRSLVLSGSRDRVNEVVGTLAAHGVQAARLTVSHAFHSPLMDPILADFDAVAARVRYSPPQTDLISNLTGALVRDEVVTPDYWCRHLRGTVRFAAGIETLKREGCHTCLEIGPKPVLLDLARQSFAAGTGTWLASLRPGQPDMLQILQSLSALYTMGVSIDWTRFYASHARTRVTLPRYPFERQRYWLTPSKNPAPAKAVAGAPVPAAHPLLGDRCWVAGSDEIRYQARIAVDSPRYLADHVVFDRPILPASAYVEMALAAASTVARDASALVLENVIFRQPLVLDDAKLIQTVLSPLSGGRSAFRIYSRPEADADATIATLHASGDVLIAPNPGDPQHPTLTAIRTEASTVVPLEWFDCEFERRRIAFGPAFRAITHLWRGPDRALARVEAPAAVEEDLGRYYLHPALLDACCRSTGVFSFAAPNSETLLQVGIERLQFYRSPGPRMWASAGVRSVRLNEQDTWVADCEIFDESGARCVVIHGQSARVVNQSVFDDALPQSRSERLYEIEWVAKAAREAGASAYVATPSAIGASLRSAIAAVSADPGLIAYGKFLLKLDHLAHACITHAFARTDWTFRVGDRFSTFELARRLGVVEHHLRFFDRLLCMFAETGVLDREGESWRVATPAPSIDVEKQVAELADEFPNGRVELSLVEESGRKLLAVLRGTTDPLDFLFPKGKVSRIAALYEDTAGAMATHAVFRTALATAVEGVPRDGCVRVLEVGAGSGATTACLLDVLARRQSQYTFTDVSARFLTHAEKRFADYPFIEYRTLDIEQPPAQQGFGLNRYDIVVATNVLHATRDLRQALAHIHDLLAPDGTLFVLEGTVSSPWLDLVFGMLPGWWRYEDTDLRPSHPLVSGDVWKQVLREQGFSDAVVAGADATTSGALGRQVAIVARTKERQAVPIGDVTGSWLILADTNGVGEHLGELLASAGESCCLLYRDGRLSGCGSERLTIEAGRADQLAALVEESSRPPKRMLGCVYLWSLDAATPDDLSVEDLARAAVAHSAAVLRLTQALTRSIPEDPPRLWLVTRDTQPAGRSRLVSGLVNAPLVGMGKVIALEHPEHWGGMIDLPPERSVDDAVSVLRELLHSDGEDQVAFRDGERLVARLTERQYPGDKPLRFRSDATYLITGGLGALGLEIVGWMIAQGALHFCLVGRRDPIPATVRDAVRRLEKTGADIQIVTADVGDPAQMRKVFAICDRLPPLRGVVHAAGIPAAGDLDRLEEADLAAAFTAKVSGTWLLHELTRDVPLDFFVLCSSMVAVWGAKGQADYVAANAFLDAMGQYRRTLGLPALSINWGPLAGGGMLPAASAGDLARLGVATTPVAQAGAVLGDLLRSDALQVAPVNINWRLFRRVYEMRAKRPLFENLQAESPQRSRVQRRHVIDEIRQALTSERVEIIREHVTRTFAEVLGLTPVHISDPRTGFFDLGMDSLTAMEFRDRLESSLGLSLPATVALDYSTVETLAAHLLASLPETDAARDPDRSRPEQAEPDLIRMLQELSDQEVEALLVKKLDRL